MKHLFIVNPAAGKGMSLKLIPEIEKIFSDKNESCEIKITAYPGHATEIAKEYVKTDNYRVYSVGGDGTLNEVLNGVIGSKSSIAIIPCGSGNDFIRNICKEPDVKQLVKRSIEGKEKVIDVAKVNDRYFINISSVGFDAEVVFNARKLKKIPFISGSMAYIISIIATAFSYNNCNLNICIDNNVINESVLLTTVSNGRYYGGGMIPTPEAKIDDGVFDICLIKALKKLKILTFFMKFIKGKHGEIKEVNFYKGKKVEFLSELELPFNIDGEIVSLSKAKFEVIPEGVKMVIP